LSTRRTRLCSLAPFLAYLFTPGWSATTMGNREFAGAILQPHRSSLRIGFRPSVPCPAERTRSWSELTTPPRPRRRGGDCQVAVLAATAAFPSPIFPRQATSSFSSDRKRPRSTKDAPSQAGLAWPRLSSPARLPACTRRPPARGCRPSERPSPRELGDSVI